MNALQQFLQSASNEAAGAVSAPVDMIAWALRKAGVPVPQNALMSSDWMKMNGLMADVPQTGASLAGQTFGLLSPVAAAAKAPQIAKGLLQAGDNLTAAKTVLGPQARQRGMIPVRFVRNDAVYGNKVSFLEDGTAVVERQPGGFSTYSDIQDEVLMAAQEKYGNKYDHFFRFTNNADELAIASKNKLRNSVNHRDGVREAGVSVADGPHYGAQGYKYGYRVKGDVIGYGSDGEPLLDPKTMEVIDSALSKPADIVRHDRTLLERRLVELGLPPNYFDGYVKFLNDKSKF